MPGADKKWDAAAERDLCVAIIMGNQESDRVRYNWAKVHSFMENYGYPFTKDAISQHFSKVIMKDFKARHNHGTAGGTKAASAASTPVKKSTTPKNAKGSMSAPAKRRRVKREDMSGEEDNIGSVNEDDEMEIDTPCKKKKKRTKRPVSEPDYEETGHGNGADGDSMVKQEESASGRRERSATLADNEDEFRAWLHEDSFAESS